MRVNVGVGHIITLSSPGVYCGWNPHQPQLLIIAERNGTIRLHNSETYELLFTLFEPGSDIATSGVPRGLRAADWSWAEPNLFGAVIGNQWFVWDLKKMPIHRPDASGDAHERGPVSFRWALARSTGFAISVNGSGGALKMYTSIQNKDQCIAFQKFANAQTQDAAKFKFICARGICRNWEEVVKLEEWQKLASDNSMLQEVLWIAARNASFRIDPEVL
ncbi:Nucleoporin Nup37 [Rhizophlyctis rosea]|uniref:Nucleoporin Nup37 n=1 Tax=Rhizophlyctis rosea TaxID=64517 RepID=A0AAD5SJL8_9FUNG|nr:Nucleoporin Nup37 [Rhizophlyctis rosea]